MSIVDEIFFKAKGPFFGANDIQVNRLHRKTFDFQWKAFWEHHDAADFGAVSRLTRIFSGPMFLTRRGNFSCNSVMQGTEDSYHVLSLLVAQYISSFYFNFNGTVFISEELAVPCRFLGRRNNASEIQRRFIPSVVSTVVPSFLMCIFLGFWSFGRLDGRRKRRFIVRICFHVDGLWQ